MLITIITALNGFDESILQTFESLPLDRPEFEWIVKTNMGFVDQRLAKLVRNENVRIVASNDKSIYQGLNQALVFAKGQYFIVLGAGDELKADSVPALIHAVKLASTESSSIFFPIFMRSLGVVFHPKPELLHTGMTTPHPGAVLLTKNVKEIGGFDERYRIAGDYDLLCRYIKKWNHALVSTQILVDFKGGGLSEVFGKEASIEEALIRLRNFTGKVPSSGIL
jgi:hypothetical protein